MLENGGRFSNLEEFYDEVDKVLTKEMDCKNGHNATSVGKLITMTIHVKDWSPSFVKEMKRRRKEMVNGSAATFSWEETKKAALNRVKSKKK